MFLIYFGCTIVLKRLQKPGKYVWIYLIKPWIFKGDIYNIQENLNTLVKASEYGRSKLITNSVSNYFLIPNTYRIPYMIGVWNNGSTKYKSCQRMINEKPFKLWVKNYLSLNMHYLIIESCVDTIVLVIYLLW